MFIAKDLKCFAVFTLSFVYGATAQDLYLLSAGSAEGQSGNYSITATIGESAVWTGGSGQIIVTQGFQQPGYLAVVSAPDLPGMAHWQLALAPNPAHTHLDIRAVPPPDAWLDFDVFDSSGRCVATVERLPETGFFHLEVAHWAAGQYVIRFIDRQGHCAVFQFLIIR